MQSSKILKQLYLIMEELPEGRGQSKFLEYVFKDYSEARRTAQQIVNDRNSTEEANGLKMREIIPDCWSNAKMTIEIVAVEAKELTSPKKDYVLKRGSIIIPGKQPPVYKMNLHIS